MTSLISPLQVVLRNVLLFVNSEFEDLPTPPNGYYNLLDKDNSGLLDKDGVYLVGK